MFYEAGTKTGNWPTQDPCGQNHQNHVKGVSNPGGAIYIGPDAPLNVGGLDPNVRPTQCSAEFPRSCDVWKKDHDQTTDGTYYICPTPDACPQRVYCMMSHDESGWTLVWSYGFTDYNNFG